MRTQAAGNLPSHPCKGLESLPQGRVLVAPVCVIRVLDSSAPNRIVFKDLLSFPGFPFTHSRNEGPASVCVGPSGTWGVGVRPLTKLTIEDRCFMVSFRTWGELGISSQL